MKHPLERFHFYTPDIRESGGCFYWCGWCGVEGHACTYPDSSSEQAIGYLYTRHGVM
ncbi:MAG: hypothetical protein R8K20_11245 [Gallionellaceae bacterium]